MKCSDAGGPWADRARRRDHFAKRVEVFVQADILAVYRVVHDFYGRR